MILLVPDPVSACATHILLHNSCPAVVNHGDAIGKAIFLTTVLLIDDGEVKHVDKDRVDLVEEDGLGDVTGGKVDGVPGELILRNMLPLSNFRRIEKLVWKMKMMS